MCFVPTDTCCGWTDPRLCWSQGPVCAPSDGPRRGCLFAARLMGGYSPEGSGGCSWGFSEANTGAECGVGKGPLQSGGWEALSNMPLQRVCMCVHLHARACRCMRVCTCGCEHAFVYLCAHVWMHVNAFTCMCMHLHESACVHAYACVFMCVHACACLFMNVCTCICRYMHVCTHVCIRVHAFA